MAAPINNGFLRVHEQPGGLEEALRDPLTLFIITDNKGDAYIKQAAKFLLPQCPAIAKCTSSFSPDDGNISFLGWFISPDIPREQIPLSVRSALRPGLSAIFTVRVPPDTLVDIAQQINGSVTPSNGLTSLYPWPGMGALLQGVMLAKFISTFTYCSKCGKRLTMRNQLCLAQICKDCDKEYFLPIKPYVCGVVFHDDAILLTKASGTDSENWTLPLMELDVCETPIHALIAGLYDLTAVDLQRHACSIDMLDLTVSVADICGLVSVCQVTVDTAFKLQDDERAHWFTRKQCADILKRSQITEESVDGFILGAWISRSLNEHIAKAPAPFDKVQI